MPADQSWNPFAQFGVTDWEPLFANLIAFVVIVAILTFFAIKPIQAMLETRKNRIIEGEEMRKESERQLADIKNTKKDLLLEANREGQQHIDEAKKAAASLFEKKEHEASKMAGDIVEKSRDAMAIEARKAEEALKADFIKLVAAATSRVSGKVLTDDDQQRINQELINSL